MTHQHKRAVTDHSARLQPRSLNVILPPLTHFPDSACKMAAVASSSTTAFQSHLLSLLSTISAAPSPSYPFPASATPPAFPLRPYGGKKTSSEEAIERGILALAERLSQAERPPLPNQPSSDTPALLRQPSPSPASTKLLTPEWTPPPDEEIPRRTTVRQICPACDHHIELDVTPTQDSVVRSYAPKELEKIETDIHPEESLPSALPSASSGGWAGDSGMSAEKELELLKRQVQDIARVCKVSRYLSIYISVPSIQRPMHQC